MIPDLINSSIEPGLTQENIKHADLKNRVFLFMFLLYLLWIIV